jgi:hypothetical protein
MPATGTLDFAARVLPGGKAWFIAHARAAKGVDPRVDHVVTMWDRLSRYKQNLVPLDELCAAAGLEAGEFVGIVARAVFELNNDVAMIQVLMALPGIVKTAVARARVPNGTRERRMFFEWVGCRFI